MDSDRIRRELEEELSRCVRCGACRNLCPVFYAENREDSSPRGKNTLLMHLLEGDFQSDDVRKLLSSCTLCEACITGCPNEVHTYRVVLYGRILSPPPFPEREVYSLFKNNSLMKNGEKLLSLIQERFFIKKENLYQLKWRIGGIDKYIPEVPSKDFFALYREMPNQEKYDKKVLFFVGCLIRYLYPETGIHLVEILNEYGWGVIAPEEQVCCGLPAISNGLLEEFLKSMRTNVELFNKYSYPYILSACGSCGNTLKNYYPDFKRESDLET